MSEFWFLVFYIVFIWILDFNSAFIHSFLDVRPSVRPSFTMATKARSGNGRRSSVQTSSSSSSWRVKHVARAVVQSSMILMFILFMSMGSFADEQRPFMASTPTTVKKTMERAMRGTFETLKRLVGYDDARCGSNGRYCEAELCERLRAELRSSLRGQPTGSALLADAVCDFLETPVGEVRKPLVVSLHGSPGVGKSFFHRILARAAYNATTTSLRSDEECPGSGCPGYKIIFGTDYVVRERAEQGRMLRDAITAHLEKYPESVVVVEEYDKLGCPARGVLKQMLEHGSAGNEGNPFDRNVTFPRAVFVLEANMGFMDVHDASVANGKRVEGDALATLQRQLKDSLFSKWTDDGCENREDTLKAVGAIDLFVPFVPLDRVAVKSIIHGQLERRGALKKRRSELRRLEWDDKVLDRLVDEVEFEGEYAIEGGKEVAIVLSRCVTRAIRLLSEREIERAGTDGVGSPARALRDRVVRLKPNPPGSSAPITAVLVA